MNIDTMCEEVDMCHATSPRCWRYCLLIQAVPMDVEDTMRKQRASFARTDMTADAHVKTYAHNT